MHIRLVISAFDHFSSFCIGAMIPASISMWLVVDSALNRSQVIYMIITYSPCLLDRDKLGQDEEGSVSKSCNNPKKRVCLD